MDDKYYNNLIMNNNESKEYNNNAEKKEYNSINDKEFNISNNDYINNNSKSISNNFNNDNDNRKNNEDIINNKNIDVTNNNNDNIAFDENKDRNISSYDINGQNKSNIKNDDLISNENKNVDSEEKTIPIPMPTNNEIDKIKEKIKEKKDDILNQINTINQITQKHKIVNENYRKALLLSLNLGFLLPKKIYSLYISSPYLYNNIKKEVLLRVALKKLENDYIKLNYFILEHVSYINF